MKHLWWAHRLIRLPVKRDTFVSPKSDEVVLTFLAQPVVALRWTLNEYESSFVAPLLAEISSESSIVAFAVRVPAS